MKKFTNFMYETLSLIERAESLSGASNTDKGTMHEYSTGQGIIAAAGLTNHDKGHMVKFKDKNGKSPKEGFTALYDKMGQHANRYVTMGNEAGKAVLAELQKKFPNHKVDEVFHTPGGAKDVALATGKSDPENTKPDLVVALKHKNTGTLSHIGISNKVYGGESSPVTWDNRPSAGFDTRLGMSSNAMDKHHNAHLKNMENYGFSNTGARGEQAKNNERYKRQFRDPVDAADKGKGEVTQTQREVKEAVDKSSHTARTGMANDIFQHLDKLSNEAGQEKLHSILMNHLSPPINIPVLTLTSIDHPNKDKEFTHKITDTHQAIKDALLRTKGQMRIAHTKGTTSVHMYGKDEKGKEFKFGEFSVVGKGEKFSSPEVITKIHPSIAHPTEVEKPVETEPPSLPTAKRKIKSSYEVKIHG
jgi:hypothetical protein